MMEFIDSYNLTGLVIGISTFLIIGLFHPVVIKCEYYFRYFRYHCCFVCPASLVVVFIGGFRLFFFLDDPGDLRTKRKGKEGMVSDESETEKGI